jgi:hypothetical protein
MCENHEHEHEAPDINEFEVVDVAGATLTLVGVLVGKYLDDDYCDPLMYKALRTARELATRLADIANEHGDEPLEEQARELITSFDFTLIEAGEVMNGIIERNDLPVLKNTFEIDFSHPKIRERLGEE